MEHYAACNRCVVLHAASREVAQKLHRGGLKDTTFRAICENLHKHWGRVARPGRLELPTLCLEGRRSIQLSYGRILDLDSKTFRVRQDTVLHCLTTCVMADVPSN